MIVPRRYLDHAATSFPKPEEVTRAMTRYLTDVGVAAGRGASARAVEAGRVVAEARGKLARLLHVEDPNRIVFTLNATDALHLAFLGILKPGDRVVTTVMEHNSVLRPLRSHETRGGVVVRVAADAEGVVQLSELRTALVPGTRLLAIQHASNVTGAIQPVAEAAALAHRVGALVLVDAAQTMGTRAVDPAELGADLVAFAGHKGLLGPLGTGALWVAPHVDLAPVREGGTGTHSEDDRQPSSWPDRHESGSANTPGIAGLDAALDVLLARGIDAIAAHKAMLGERFLERIRAVGRVEVFGPTSMRAREAVFPLRIPGLDPHELALVLDSAFGIEVRAGLHCAPLAHRAIGTFEGGAVRASFGMTSTEDDVDAIVSALASIAQAMSG